MPSRSQHDLAVLVIGLTLACHPTPRPITSPRQAPLASAIRAIRLERGPCMAVSACPGYTYTFRRGTPAYYHGPARPSAGAEAIADFSPEAFDRMAAWLVDSQFFAMQPHYAGPLDSPMTTITAWYGFDSMVVAADAGAMAPLALTRLQALLDSAGRSLVWRSPVPGPG